MSFKFQVSSFKLAVVFVILALAGCSTTPPPGPEKVEMSRVTSAARLSFDQGSPEQAARLYVRALRMARTRDDAVEIGNNAYNLAACLITMGKLDDARNLLREAKREFERAKRPVAQVILLDAKAARLQGNFDEASVLADQVVASVKEGDAGSYPLQVILFKAQVACDRNDLSSAKAEFAKAQKPLKEAGDAVLQAEAAGVSARIALLEGDPARAAQEYDRQSDFCKRAKKYRDMAQSFGAAGQAYLDANILLPAVDRFYRSARSLHAQGDELGALKVIELALATGEKAGDKDSLARTAALFGEIKKSIEDKKPAAEKTP